MRVISKIALWALMLAFIFTAVPQVMASTWHDDIAQPPGLGTSISPFQISTPQHLAWLSWRLANGQERTAHVVLNNNINLSGRAWIPIGRNSGQSFNGNLNGQNNTITGLNINATADNNTSDYQGLFGHVGGLFERNAAISNLTLANVSITGRRNVGALAGASYGTITNVHVTSGSVTGAFTVGGLVGLNDYHALNSSSRANVAGINEVGGFAGRHQRFGTPAISNSTAFGNVTGSGNDLGGLVGLVTFTGAIHDSMAFGNITGGVNSNNVGGLVGGGNGPINNSVSSGRVTGSSNVGGLVGHQTGRTLSNNLSLSVVRGSGSNIGGLIGAIFNAGNPHAIIENSIVAGSARRIGANSGQGVGGLIGFVDGTTITLRNNLSVARVSATANTTNVGALIGHSLSNNLFDLVADSFMSGQTHILGSNPAAIGPVQINTATLTNGSRPIQFPAADWTVNAGYYPIPTALINHTNTTIRALAALAATPILLNESGHLMTLAAPLTTRANAANGNPITWTSRPNILTIGSITGATRQISLNQQGEFFAELTAATTAAQPAVRVFELGDYARYNFPAITTDNTLPAAQTGMPYSVTLMTSGTGVTWALASGSLPNGLSLSSAGVLSGTPTAFGSFNFTLRAANSNGYDTRLFTLVINAVPAITQTSLPWAVINEPYSQQLNATGHPAVTSWALTSGSLPVGLSLNSATGLISGTPTALGSSTFAVVASNGAGNSAPRNLTITISAGPVAPTMTTPVALPSADAGANVSIALTADGTAATWSLAPGSSLPDGLVLSSGGVISGTPTQAGTFSFTIMAQNVAGLYQRIFSIDITAAPITAILTIALPNGIIGTAYNATLDVDGTPPITWSIASGNLPGGLSLNQITGEISGTPNAAGEFVFTVQASNLTTIGGVSRELSIIVESPDGDGDDDSFIRLGSGSGGCNAAGFVMASLLLMLPLFFRNRK